MGNRHMIVGLFSNIFSNVERLTPFSYISFNYGSFKFHFWSHFDLSLPTLVLKDWPTQNKQDDTQILY